MSFTISIHELAVWQAIELKPDFSKAYSRLGTAHFQAGRYKEALDEGYRKVRCVCVPACLRACVPACVCMCV